MWTVCTPPRTCRSPGDPRAGEGCDVVLMLPARGIDLASTLGPTRPCWAARGAASAMATAMERPARPKRIVIAHLHRTMASL